MLAIDAAALDRAIDTRALIEALRQAFRREVEAPLRHHHTMPTAAGDATLLIMPAWEREQAIGIKLVSLMPGNPARDLPF
ncbi:MAG TPA: ornithine cyclodeaminase family protein, partial [Inquilinus sp.]